MNTVEAGVHVVEVDRPDRRARRAQGKSDPLDAYSAARAALSGRASVVPKVRDGKVEAIRAIRVARSSAVKARTQATNQLKALIVTGSPGFREQLRHLSTPLIVAHCARLRPSPDLGDRRTHEGLAKPEIIRRLKSYVAREIYNTLNLAMPARKPEQYLPDIGASTLQRPAIGSASATSFASSGPTTVAAAVTSFGFMVALQIPRDVRRRLVFDACSFCGRKEGEAGWQKRIDLP